MRGQRLYSSQAANSATGMGRWAARQAMHNGDHARGGPESEQQPRTLYTPGRTGRPTAAVDMIDETSHRLFRT